MKRIVVTGGFGFIGSHYVRYLRRKHPDYHIVIVDKFTYAGNPDNVDLTDNKVAMIAGDISNPDIVKQLELFGPVDYLVNFAAETFVDSSIHASQNAFIDSNVRGTVNLLNWLREHPEVRYLQVSTDEVYGDLPLVGDEKFSNASAIHPNNPYSASKAAADHFVMSYVHTYGLNAVVTRCSNNYGSHQFPEKFIPRMIGCALADEPLPVYGTGENIRDWIHVSDHVAGIDEALHHGQTGTVYNFGGEAERTNIEVVHNILDILDKPRSLIEYVTDRPGHDRRYSIDITDVLSQLNWAPHVRYVTGLEDTVKWYVDNPEWSERIRTGAYRRMVPGGRVA